MSEQATEVQQINDELSRIGRALRANSIIHAVDVVFGVLVVGVCLAASVHPWAPPAVVVWALLAGLDLITLLWLHKLAYRDG